VIFVPAPGAVAISKVPPTEEVLHGVVVQNLEAPALAVLGAERLGDEPPTLVGRGADPPIARTKERRENDGAGAGPRQMR
jgi:hypothetical protein